LLGVISAVVILLLSVSGVLAITWNDSTIDTSEAIDLVETEIDVSADPTVLIPIGSRVKVDDEPMDVTGGSAGAAIDGGAGTSFNATDAGPTHSHLDLTNPINATGIVDTIKICARSDSTGVKVGAFYLISGTTWKCRSVINIGDVISGAERSFSVSLAVVAGDILGFYSATGNLGRKSPGGSGSLIVTSTDTFVAGNQTTYTLVSNYGLALYGTGLAPSSLSVTRASPAAHDSGKDIYVTTKPIVTTNTASDVSTMTVTLNGNTVPTVGDTTIRGFEWGTQSGVYTGSWSESGNFTGDFSYPLSVIEDSTDYYYRAFGTSAEGTDYGSEMSLTTLIATWHQISYLAPLIMIVMLPLFVIAIMVASNTPILGILLVVILLYIFYAMFPGIWFSL
jgi:hypothetical protein